MNIIKLEEHVEDNQFFIRIEWSDTKSRDVQFWDPIFQPFIDDNQAICSFKNHEEKSNIVLFCSKPLHCLLNILNHIQMGDFLANVVAVVSNHDTAKSYVKSYNIPFHFCPYQHSNRKSHEKEILSVLKKYQFECIGLARYMRVISPYLLSNVKVPMINVHHSFLPSFIGANPYQQAYSRGVKVIGATSHYVTEHLDEGPIIHQHVAPISHLDSPESLKLLGKNSETQVFLFALQKQVENKIIEFNGRTIIFN